MFGKKWSYMIGTRLCDLRKMRNMTQKELAEKLSLSVNSISMYERGLSTPNDDVKIKIAQIFHVSLDYLLGNVDEKIQNPSSLRSYRLPQRKIPYRLRLLYHSVACGRFQRLGGRGLVGRGLPFLISRIWVSSRKEKPERFFLPFLYSVVFIWYNKSIVEE